MSKQKRARAAAGAAAAALLIAAAGGTAACRQLLAPRPKPQPAASASAAAQAQPVGEEGYNAAYGVVDTVRYAGTVLAETEDAGQAYVDETLFLGDSNTVRYMMYADGTTGRAFTTLENNIGVVSMGAGAIPTLKCMEFVGLPGAKTMPEAVAILQPRRVLIGFGTNNLTGGVRGVTSFIGEYKKGLAAIRKAYPAADIIVNSIPPLDARRENPSLLMSVVDLYNQELIKLCEEEGYYYLNSAEALKDASTGWAKQDYTLGDGVHLSMKGVSALFSYLRTHALHNPDTRPKPLAKIPQPKGVEPGLISADPIAVRGARINIEVTATEGGTASAASSLKAGQSTALTASPYEGFLFKEWILVSGSASLAGDTLTLGEGNDANGVVVRAVFEPDPSLAEETPTPEPSAAPASSDASEPTPSPSPTPSPTPEAAPSPTPAPTYTPAPTPSPTPTPESSAVPPESISSPAPEPAPEAVPAPAALEAPPAGEGEV